MANNIIQLNDNKAGMQGIDKEKINSIILEHSQGSKFYENELKKEKLLNKQIEDTLQRLERLTPEMILRGEKEADKMISHIQEKRELSRCLVHVDMDAFYAAVEMRDNPKLRHKPMAVGSKSMLSTSNYIARRFGVRAAMPGFIALKLCPELEIVPCDFAKYAAVSRDVRAVFSLYDPGYAAVSLDEAYLDVTEHLLHRLDMSEEERTLFCTRSCRCRKRPPLEDESRETDMELAVCQKCYELLRPGDRVFGVTVEETVREMRYRIFTTTKLTASAGIAPNTLLAKIASDRNKPNGQFRVQGNVDEVTLFIQDLPVRKIPGIGKVSDRKLNALGVSRCGDLYSRRGVLYQLCSTHALRYYMRIALGEGDTRLETDAEKKSISCERTFSVLECVNELLQKCRELSTALSEDMIEEHMKGKTVTLKLKLDSFEVRTRAQTLTDWTNDPALIYACASELLQNEVKNAAPKPLRLRLMGVRMSSLIAEEMCHSAKQWTIQKAFAKASQKPASITKTLNGELTDDKKDQTDCASMQEEITAADDQVCDRLSESPKGVTRDHEAECPVCGRVLQLGSLEEMNDHLDHCLSKEAIQHAVRETHLTSQPGTGNHERNKLKRPLHVDARKSSSKSRKTGPLDKFFRS